MEKKLFLLDAMALIYRAFYAMNKNPRISSKGLNTSAILGFANTLFDVIKNEKPTHIGVAFDTMAPTVRHEGFADYKAHRQETPEDLIRSLPYIHTLLDAFNIPVLAVDGFEADDVIGTLAREAEKRDFLTYIMTSDKDLGQLVSDKTLIYRPAKFGAWADVLGVKEVCEKFGITQPEQIKDLLGLWGDASDNIPGIPGIGEVTAKKLIAEFGTIENLIANVQLIANEKLREKVITHKEQALMSKELATIILDVPVEFDEEYLRLSMPDPDKLKTILDELEFRAFGQRVLTWMSLSPAVTPTPVDSPAHIRHPASGIEDPATSIEQQLSDIHTTPHTYYLSDTPDKRADLIETLRSAGSFCFDTETTGLDPATSELVGLSFAVRPHEAWYVPLPANYHEAHQVLGEFREVFEDEKIGKTGQNMKFDISMLRWYDIRVKGPMFDTMLAHYLLQPDMRHNMDLLSETYLGYKPVPIESLIGKKGQGQLSMNTVDIEQVKDYAAEDADVTLRLRRVFEPMLEETRTLDLFEQIEVPLIPVLASMEAEGIRIDVKTLEDYSGELEKEIRATEEAIYADAGTLFNIASPRQLGEILFDRLKIVDNPKQTRTKQYSTSEDVLVKLEHKHPIISKILEYRGLTKLKSTYVDVLPALVSPRDGRVHTSYNQAVAATGRLSSNNPNLQNIPIRTEKGREIRKAFIPRNDQYLLLSADYSQIELRIVASISGDASMIADFVSGLDIHQSTAAKIYHLKPAEVTKEMRRNAKAVNFGIIYGMSAFGLSERLGIPRKEAAEIIDHYFAQYPGIRTYMQDTIAFAKQHGYVETLKKRRRYLRDINSSNATVRGFAERNAINAPIQGTAADMIKIAMIRIFEEMEKRKLRSKMILQVHDELVFDMHVSEEEDLKNILLKEMPEAIPLSVPVNIGMSTGRNWLEAH
jgi:DNA polymerase-1